MNAMKRILAGMMILFVMVPFAARAAIPEARDGFVNDFANVINDADEAALEQELVQLEKDTTAEFAVVTVGSLEGWGAEDYSRALATKWKVGKQGKNNGIVLLFAPNEG